MAARQESLVTERELTNVKISLKKEEKTTDEPFDFSDVVADLRATFNTGKTKDLRWRKQQLRQLQLMVKENYEDISSAFLQDHSGPKLRSFVELAPCIEAGDAIKQLDKWAAPVGVPHRGPNPLDALNGKSYIKKEPKGVVLIICPWNFPIALTLQCMIPVIAAGNCCIVKPSEVSANSSDILENLIPKYFDRSCIRLVTGGVAETTALLREKYDHIFYTGNGAVGRIIMEAAAKHLTPCTLELGGKSPTYVDKSAKLDVAKERINCCKWFNAGQICVAPDYLLVHKDVVNEFREMLRSWLNKHLGMTQSERKANPSFGRVINARHVHRIHSLVKSSTGKVVEGGDCDTKDHYFAATIVEDPCLDDPIMKEEIFGPVLPLIVVDSVEDAVTKVNKICTHPLALYIFAQDQAAIDYYLENTSSGGVCVNSCMEHIMTPHLPFGGIGESGMGQYHGIFGFDEFSHSRSVFVKDTVLYKGWVIPAPPYSDELFNLAVKSQIVGFFTETQKRKLKLGGLCLLFVIALMLSRSV